VKKPKAKNEDAAKRTMERETAYQEKSTRGQLRGSSMSLRWSMRCQTRLATLLLPLVAIRMDEEAQTYTQ